MPPIVRPELMRRGLLVEVLPQWHLPVFELTIAHLRDCPISRQVRVFKEFAAQMVPQLFPSLPT